MRIKYARGGGAGTVPQKVKTECQRPCSQCCSLCPLLFIQNNWHSRTKTKFLGFFTCTRKTCRLRNSISHVLVQKLRESRQSKSKSNLRRRHVLRNRLYPSLHCFVGLHRQRRITPLKAKVSAYVTIRHHTSPYVMLYLLLRQRARRRRAEMSAYVTIH
jgi:hypothetical protein